MTFKIAFALVFLVSAVIGQETPCTNPKVMENFDVKQYVGGWYEVEKNPVVFENDFRCGFVNFTQVDDHFSFYLQGVQKNGETKTFTGKVTFPDKNEPAKHTVVFDNNARYVFDYRILDTDYQQYSVTYACNTDGDQANHEYLWIWSRAKTLAPKTLEKVHQFLDDLGVDRTKLEKSDQSC